MTAPGRLFSLSARFGVLTVAILAAWLGLAVPSSLVSRVAEVSNLHEPLNVVALALCALGLADVIWHDIGGRLIWPSLNPRWRHGICVLTYSLLGAIWLLKAWVAVWSGVPAAGVLTVFCLAMAVPAGLVAVALALEDRA